MLMYRQAIAKKKKGALLGSVVIVLFMIATFAIAMKYTIGWVLFGFCALFAVLMISSLIHISRSIRQMEQDYPGSLELDVDNCDPDDQVAGKYFFLPPHLVDPFNARMIKYDDIRSVKSIKTKSDRHDVAASRDGRTVNIVTKNMAGSAMPIIFNDFGSGMARIDDETIANYEKFMSLLGAHLGEDADITEKQL